MNKINSIPYFINIADGENKDSILGNRIRKNYRHLRKWGKRTKTDCFRIYDKEIAQYPLAIDYYSGRFCVHYFACTRLGEEPSIELVKEVNEVLFSVFSIMPDNIFWRTRKKNKETRQYEKIGDTFDFFVVHEYGAKFYINLVDYLDTGLFLDHRETRQLVAAACKGKRLLNLFSYTGSFNVHAALAGASFTKSVDMSNTYTAWSKENFILNNLSLKQNIPVRADCLKFLDGEINSGNKYDIIVIDPPTISRSKKMDQLFDIQVEYVTLLNKSLQLLSKEGVIYFSTNSRKFHLDTLLFPSYRIVELSHRTVPLDFHDKKMHRCWCFKPNHIETLVK